VLSFFGFVHYVSSFSWLLKEVKSSWLLFSDSFDFLQALTSFLFRSSREGQEHNSPRVNLSPKVKVESYSSFTFSKALFNSSVLYFTSRYSSSSSLFLLHLPRLKSVYNISLCLNFLLVKNEGLFFTWISLSFQGVKFSLGVSRFLWSLFLWKK